MRKLLVLLMLLALAAVPAQAEAPENPFADWLDVAWLVWDGVDLWDQPFGGQEDADAAADSRSDEPQILRAGMAGMITPVGLTNSCSPPLEEGSGDDSSGEAPVCDSGS